VERVAYAGWPNCYRLSNGIVDLIVTADVGPRIIRFGFLGQTNEFAEINATLGRTGGDEFRLYGGHRLWHAPEHLARTYCPDNAPVAVEEHADGLRVVQPVEPSTGIGKAMDIHLLPEAACAQVTHRLRNHTLWPVELAPWALSMMAPDGTCIIPLRRRSLEPADAFNLSAVVLWGFTDMSDARWTWARDYVMLRQDAGTAAPQKVGVASPEGWVAYLREGHLFVVRVAHDPAAVYPDGGCTVEAYTNADFLEVETVGPLVQLEPGATVEHTEHWYLFDGLPPRVAAADIDPVIAQRATVQNSLPPISDRR
jgi:hypothetical protein